MALAAMASALASTAAATAAHSPLAPHGAPAGQMATLAWILFGGGLLVFIVVMVVAALALRGRARRPRWMHVQALLIGGGIVFPAVVLVALLVYSQIVQTRLQPPPAAAPLRLEIVGQMWWWRVHYLDANGATILTTANELHVPAGRPIEVALRSEDVIHSFWVPSLAGMLDLIPGRVNTLRFTAEVPGALRGQCTEFCGLQHAKMGFDVRVHDPREFDAWFERQREPAREPGDEALRRGRQLFDAHCASCHTVRGTAAKGTSGPDLTHVGSRASIAAGSLPNNAGTIAGWIASNQHLKPGNRMPEFPGFSGAELNAVARYVASLQ